VEAEEIIEIGDIPSEQVHLPGLYVNLLFKGEKFDHKIEILKTAEPDTSNKGHKAAKAPKDPREIDCPNRCTGIQDRHELQSRSGNSHNGGWICSKHRDARLPTKREWNDWLRAISREGLGRFGLDQC
jgi:hypothetical protein